MPDRDSQVDDIVDLLDDLPMTDTERTRAMVALGRCPYHPATALQAVEDFDNRYACGTCGGGVEYTITAARERGRLDYLARASDTGPLLSIVNGSYLDASRDR